MPDRIGQGPKGHCCQPASNPEKGSRLARPSGGRYQCCFCFRSQHAGACQYRSLASERFSNGFELYRYLRPSRERVAGREHFPNDVLVGDAVGYFIGGYVFDHRSARSKTHVVVAPILGHGGGVFRCNSLGRRISNLELRGRPSDFHESPVRESKPYTGGEVKRKHDCTSLARLDGSRQR